MLFGAATALVRAQDATPPAMPSPVDLQDAPVGLHDGTCADPTLESRYDVGELETLAANEAAAGVLDDDDLDDNGVADLDEEGYLDEDLDDDGILDDGEDLNENGVLDRGVDVDGDGILGEADAFVVAIDLPTVYRADEEIDATFDDLFGEPVVIAVHASADDYGTILACGELTAANWEDEEDVVIPIAPVGGSGIYGYAVFERDTGNVPIFGENTTGVTTYLFEGLSTLRGERLLELDPGEAGDD